MQIELGRKVADKLTGFCGIVTGRCEYITGCNQVLVQPRVKDDGEFVESRWFDEDRMEPVSDEVFSLSVMANGPDKPAPRK